MPCLNESMIVNDMLRRQYKPRKVTFELLEAKVGLLWRFPRYSWCIARLLVVVSSRLHHAFWAFFDLHSGSMAAIPAARHAFGRHDCIIEWIEHQKQSQNDGTR